MPELVIKRGDYSVRIQNIAQIVYYLYFSIVIHSVDYDLGHLLRGGVCCNLYAIGTGTTRSSPNTLISPHSATGCKRDILLVGSQQKVTFEFVG